MFKQNVKVNFASDDPFKASWQNIKVDQESSSLAHEIHFPAEFSSIPNQTHLSMLINFFRIIRKSQVDEFDQGWS